MKKSRKVSRVLVVATVAFVGSTSAVCPDLFKNAGKNVEKNKFIITSTFVTDKLFAKDEHAKKAFLGSMGDSLRSKESAEKLLKGNVEDFAHRFFIDYGIRKGSEAIGVDGLKKSVLKKCDVLPDGMARDLVNPVVEGVADVATHPEMLTYLAMNHLLPFLVSTFSGK